MERDFAKLLRIIEKKNDISVSSAFEEVKNIVKVAETSIQGLFYIQTRWNINEISDLHKQRNRNIKIQVGKVVWTISYVHLQMKKM